MPPMSSVWRTVLYQDDFRVCAVLQTDIRSWMSHWPPTEVGGYPTAVLRTDGHGRLIDPRLLSCGQTVMDVSLTPDFCPTDIWLWTSHWPPTEVGGYPTAVLRTYGHGCLIGHQLPSCGQTVMDASFAILRTDRMRSLPCRVSPLTQTACGKPPQAVVPNRPKCWAGTTSAVNSRTPFRLPPPNRRGISWDCRSRRDRPCSNPRTDRAWSGQRTAPPSVQTP